MAYSDFDLRKITEAFGLTIIDDRNSFAEVGEVDPGEFLRRDLDLWSPVAVAINTEKARSELIIIPILKEVVVRSQNRVKLFSGTNFDVDRDRGLNGACDYLLARSSQQLYVDRPVIAVFEAKREDMVTGLGQCLAALVAAQTFNAREEGGTVGTVYGAVTTGTNWKFMKLDGKIAAIDKTEYFLDQPGKILGILLHFAAG